MSTPNDRYIHCKFFNVVRKLVGLEIDNVYTYWFSYTPAKPLEFINVQIVMDKALEHP
jgi:hypothetical protein